MRRTLLYLLLATLAFGLSLLVDQPDGDATLKHEAHRLEKALLLARADLQKSTANEARRCAELGTDAWMASRVAALEQEDARTGTLFVVAFQDSLVGWSGHMPADLATLSSDTVGLLPLRDGSWLHASVTVGELAVHGVRQVWYVPPIENRFLVRGFHPSLQAAPGLQVVDDDPSGIAVHDGQSTPMFTVNWMDGAQELGTWIWVRLCLVLLAAFLGLAALWRACMSMRANGGSVPALLSFIVGAVVLRAFMLWYMPVGPFSRIPLFDPAVYATSVVFPSLGDLVLNALFLFIMALFLMRSVRDSAAPGGAMRVLYWAVVLLHAAWITQLIIGLVADSSVELDLYHVQGLGVHGLVAVAGMALMFGGWAVVVYALLGPIARANGLLRSWALGMVILAASIAVHHLLGVRDTIVFLWPVIPMLVLMRVALDRPRFLHVVLGLAVLAGTTAHLLTRHTYQREQRERQALAERLASREDPVVEYMFRETAPLIRKDTALYGLLTGNRSCSSGDLDRLVRQPYFGGYWERYDVRLFAFDTTGQVLCSTDPDPPSSMLSDTSAFGIGPGVADMPDLIMEERPGQTTYYHARVAVMPVDSLSPGQLIVELHLRPVSQGAGFPELLLSGDDPLARRSERYTKARYERGKLVEQQGPVFHPLHWQRSMPGDGFLWYQEGRSEFLARGDAQGTLLVLGLPMPGPLDKATSFSYLFAFFGVLLSLAYFMHHLLRREQVWVPGIGTKVRLALVFFGTTGLVFFGIGTQRLLSRQYNLRFEADILERMRSVHADLQQRLDGEGELTDRHALYLDRLLARAGNVFRTDITLYNTHGELLATSRPQVFNNGLLGRRMDPLAYVELVRKGTSAFVHQEHIGNASFRTAYMPLRDRRGLVMAYLALPSFADQVQQEEERSSVLVAVVNLFVLMFALSVLVAVFISNWTTRPLDLLRNALGRVALQGANEPIRYKGDDEVGRLVEVYNSKVAELRESAEKLARSERESAWREMARQVAHEIKNPLTPMKLGIQHFQRTWRPDAPDAAERLERFSRAMVEQIDALSNIAGEFSNFAQMPRAQEQDLDLAEVAEGAMALIGAAEKHFTLERIAAGALPIRADREQLLRVFNNLLKNAEQSIPEGRTPKITVVLKQTAEQAIAEVHDNGSGIAAADRERIFRPNFTTKSSGMGLGLAMVQRIVESAGGRVWFETREGEGTTFFVALPLRK
ncbi:MAG: GHKL domain-containing protein [Flavobacteriales bacterium]|nr:GHKL domain-containing protein [Flavobacteriales bacterium]